MTTTNRRAERAGVSVSFFDGIGTAHSLPLIEGLDRAAASAGMRRQWTTALGPPGAAGDRCEWTPTRAFYAEFCTDGRSSSFAYRRAWQAAMKRAAAAGSEFFCDLAIEQLTTSYGAPLRVDLRAVWVVHQPPPPPDARPLALRAKIFAANPRRLRSQSRMAHSRSVLRHLARRDGRFVVPSTPAADRLARVVPRAQIHVAPWPIVSAADPPRLADGTPGEIVVVMPGEGRAGKGLDLLVAALGDIDDVTVVDLPSVVTAEAQNLVRRADDARVRMGTGWLTNAEYQGRLQAATLAVLPYRTAAAANGGISASLLDVLAVGLPAVITEPIARVLPPGYGGAVVVRPDSPAAIAEGIATALGRLDELQARARSEGPAFILAHHTYEQYLAAIVEAATA